MEYSNKIIDHFQNPKNMGQIKSPTVKAKIGNKVCGDVMELYLKIDRNNVIEDAKFQTFGCAAAIATSSILTELIIGKKVEEAKKMEPKDIDESLGGLPKIKKHCADLSIEALKKALNKLDSK
jgi:SUF system NifU family Fe-S assembly protein